MNPEVNSMDRLQMKMPCLGNDKVRLPVANEDALSVDQGYDAGEDARPTSLPPPVHSNVEESTVASEGRVVHPGLIFFLFVLVFLIAILVPLEPSSTYPVSFGTRAADCGA